MKVIFYRENNINRKFYSALDITRARLNQPHESLFQVSIAGGWHESTAQMKKLREILWNPSKGI